jgi:MoaA/NifB/PqqE/SkfB family radical SAM enzyme
MLKLSPTTLKKTLLEFITNYIGSSKDFIVQLDITNYCNLACAHCYHPHHANNGALQLHEWESALHQIEELVKAIGVKPDFTICGGEPFTSPC